MKTSAVLTSVLFGAMAVAAPFDKRALVYKTEVVTETVVVYTTVYDDEPVAQATTTPAGYFYEQPEASSAVLSSAVAPVNTPAPAPAPSSSAYVAPSPAPAPTPSPAPQQPSPAPVSSAAPVEPEQPAYTPQPQPTPQPEPTPSPAPAPAPAPASSAAPAPAPSPNPPANGGSGSGEYAGDITIYEPNGAPGACGKALGNDEMVVALSVGTWGSSTYDVMTGNPTNPWCGQKIKAFYNGRSVEATIMDMCPGCSGQDIDLSPAAWKVLTGSDEKTRYKATWTKVN